VAGTVVSKESATLEGQPSMSIRANHRDMVNFGSEDDNGFKRVLGELIRWEAQVRYSNACPLMYFPNFWLIGGFKRGNQRS
jgi:hypothetical protein